MGRFGVPGVAVGIIHGDGEEVGGFGVTSLENPLPVDGETLFQIGSITKTYTATAAMRLVEDGRLSLDDPIRSYLPDLRLADERSARALTMRHLLTHTGGWQGDYFEPLGPGDDALAQMVARLDRLEQLTPLGEVWSYNNAGFYIAGRVIEVLTGRPFELSLRELVLEPLGLEESFFFAQDVLTYRFAVGHDRRGAVLRAWSVGRPAAPAGGLVSSLSDLLTYARLQWAPNGFLSRASLAEMRRPHAEVGRSKGDAIGLGWFLLEDDGHSFVTHSGATNGQMALLVVAPKERFALAVLTNHDDGRAVNKAVRTEVLRSLLDINPPDDNYPQPSPAELVEYVGDYRGQLSDAKLTMAGNRLVLEVIPKGGFPEPHSPPRPGPPPTRLAFEGKDVVVAVDPPLKDDRSDFLRRASGEIAWFRLDGRLLRPIDETR
jgi:CubicO group peptidase (beta-lactamase class C family)